MPDDLRRLFPSDFEIQQMVALLRETMGLLVDDFDGLDIDIEEMARMTPIVQLLIEARKAHGLTIPQAAKQLGVAQAKLKSIERGEIEAIDPAVFVRYIEQLDAHDLAAHWADANPALAARLGLRPPPPAAGKVTSFPDATPGGESLPLFPDMPPTAPPPSAMRAGTAFPISPTQGSAGWPFDSPDALNVLGLPEKLAALLMGGKPAKPKPAAAATYQFKVTLLDLKPKVWRRFTVQNDITLGQLHDVLQVVMGWTDSHLHSFTIRGEDYEPSGSPPGEVWGPPVRNESKCRLADLALRVKEKLHYEYDFGDGWEHEIVLEKILPPAPGAAPACVKGEIACPLEDCGGPWGYLDALAAAKDPQHPEHETFVDWVPENFDPTHFDAAVVNEDLSRLSRSWTKRRKRKP